MIELTKPVSSDGDCPKCHDDFYHCHCGIDHSGFSDEVDGEETETRTDRHLVNTVAGVILCLFGLLGSMGGVPMSGWLIFVGAMLLL
jgi:hypothetical protein